MPKCDEIRQLETDLGFSLPSDLCTVFNARRWIGSYQKDKRKMRARMRKYLLNRELLLSENEDLFDNFFENENVQLLQRHMRMSKKRMNVNSVDNTITVIVQLGNIDYHALPYVISSRQLNIYYMLLGEYIFQQVMKQEEESNQQSGITILYDLEGMKVADYLNPFSPMMQMFNTSSTLLQENYIELLTHMYIVNAGSLLKVFMKLMKLILLPKALEKVKTVSDENWKETLCGYIEPSALPVAYGGTWREEDVENVDPLTCCSINMPFPKLSSSNRFPSMKMVNISVKSGTEKVVTVRVNNEGSTLKWLFKTSGKTEFAVSYKKDDDDTDNNESYKLLIPRMVLVTPLPDTRPECGSVNCDEAGSYSLEFRNVNSKLFSINISYCITIE